MPAPASSATSRRRWKSCSKAIAAKRLAGPELAKIYATRGSIYYFKKNDHDKAIADYSEAIRLAPKLTKAYLDRAYAYDNGKKDFDRAIADYDSVIRLDPNNAEAFAKRASSYSSKKQYDLAIADLNQAIRLAPKDSSHFFYRGMVYYYHKADYDRAIADFNEAIRLTPDRATYVASRGESYEKKGEFDRALADYRMALSIQPDNTWAKQGLERIEPKTAAGPAAPVPAAPSAAPISCHDVSGAYQAAIEACTQLIMSGKAGSDELLGAYVFGAARTSVSWGCTTRRSTTSIAPSSSIPSWRWPIEAVVQATRLKAISTARSPITAWRCRSTRIWMICRWRSSGLRTAGRGESSIENPIPKFASFMRHLRLRNSELKDH